MCGTGLHGRKSWIPQQLTLAAIDDIIGQGKRQDWAELRSAALLDVAVLERIVRVCQAHTQDPYAQRYYFWEKYAESKLDGSVEAG